MRTDGRADAARQLETVDIGHVVVGHHQTDIGIGIEDLQRLGAAFGNADAEIVALQARRQQGARRRAVIDDQDVMALVGQETADRFRQHLDGKHIVLDDIIDDILCQDLVAHLLLEAAGEHDGRNGQIEKIVQRLAVFGARQVDVGNRQRHRLRRDLVGVLKVREVAADIDLDAEQFVQPLADHRGEDIRILGNDNPGLRKRSAGIKHPGNT